MSAQASNVASYLQRVINAGMSQAGHERNVWGQSATETKAGNADEQSLSLKAGFSMQSRQLLQNFAPLCMICHEAHEK